MLELLGGQAQALMQTSVRTYVRTYFCRTTADQANQGEVLNCLALGGGEGDWNSVHHDIRARPSLAFPGKIASLTGAEPHQAAVPFHKAANCCSWVLSGV